MVFLDQTDASKRLLYDFSTVKSLRKGDRQMAPPVIRVLPLDSTNSGTTDAYKVSMTFRKPPATSLAKVDLLLGFEASLSKLVQTKLQGLAVASSSTHASASLSPAKIFFNGDLRLNTGVMDNDG